MADLVWYDRFARIYDPASLSDRYYRAGRRRAIEQLQVSAGDLVFDIFCGTGVNFPLLQERLGSSGEIIGVDGSRSMLGRAEERASRLRHLGTEIGFLHGDLSTEGGVRALCSAIEDRECRRFLFTLGLTCLPNWREFLAAIFEIAPLGSRFSILDLHSQRLTFGARLINRIGSADCRRPVWQVLQERAAGFNISWQRPFRFIDVRTFVAWGEKAASA